MRVLASVLLTAVTIILAPAGAQAEAQQRICLDNATPPAPRAAACSFVITNAPPAEARELARVYLIRGNANLALGVYDRAVADFDAATKAHPTAHGPFNSRGVAFLRQKQIDRAITEFDSAIRLNPNDPLAFTNRGDAYRDKGRIDRAMQDYDAAIVINPKWVNAYFGRAAALQQKAGSDFDAFVNEGRFEELAIAEYGKALQIAPRHAGALSNRGQLHHILRRYDLAIADFTQAIEINPANPAFLRNRALTYRMMRRFDLAIADYRNALAMTQDADGRKLIGELLAQLGAAV
ncbi:tetratricopeptide repeat protein [Bradyrhizobium sp. AUGA SZCCT0160]|uniref:tetratricopeptide repeat protein n=1 Tax=Bradyrhizobium sp. AUGA SZCCT0160 TaxID=2807662 RepID=UPI001BAB519D|nr:tetratricopeptide repeat protein [Bradyrhizobium sp. AUGA SZCCT0160]MBR1187547.1 tetratricopeptide repeat protein [Bradyrhizobium sp. AUGA SZCCT0160]